MLHVLFHQTFKENVTGNVFVHFVKKQLESIAAFMRGCFEIGTNNSH